MSDGNSGTKGADSSTVGRKNGTAFGTDPAKAAGPAPTTGAGESADNGAGNEKTGKRGPYKPRQSRPAEAATPLDVAGLAFSLRMVHDVLANATGQPLLSIRDDEAKLLAHAADGVLTAFHIPLTEKQKAVAAMVTACSTVYGPRIYAAASARSKPIIVQTAVKTGTIKPSANPFDDMLNRLNQSDANVRN